VRDNKIEAYFRICEEVATSSKDPSTKVGAIIVSPRGAIMSTGYNGFPRRVNEEGTALQAKGDGDWTPIDYTLRWERPEKYKWVIHAELNAILNAAAEGIRLEGCTLILPWDMPCNICCGCIVNAGLSEVICSTDKFPGVGKGEHYDTEEIAKTILKEGNVKLHYIRREDTRQKGLTVV